MGAVTPQAHIVNAHPSTPIDAIPSGAASGHSQTSAYAIEYGFDVPVQSGVVEMGAFEKTMNYFNL